MKLDKFKKIIANTSPEKRKEVSDMMDKLEKDAIEKGEKERVPPMPVKENGEDSFDFAARKNEWKKLYQK